VEKRTTGHDEIMKSDLILENALVAGSSGTLTVDEKQTDKGLVVRGVMRKKAVDECVKIGRDFWYVDTGYLGNFPSKNDPKGKKKWNRVVKNENQLSQLRDVPSDRFENLIKDDPRLKWNGWKNYDKKILLVMPNPKACKYYNIDYDTWVKETKEQIAKYTDLPVVERIKGSRRERNTHTIYDALDEGVYATVAFNSIAALESIVYGVPAFVSVPCAATPLASTDLSQLANPFKPTADLIEKQCHNLAYGQFTMEEMEDGTAYKLVERYS